MGNLLKKEPLSTIDRSPQAALVLRSQQNTGVAINTSDRTKERNIYVDVGRLGLRIGPVPWGL